MADSSEQYAEMLARLSKRRQFLGWTQKQAAEKITTILQAIDEKSKITGELLGKIERGEIELSMRRLLAICHAYQSHPSHIIDPESQPVPGSLLPFLENEYFMSLTEEAHDRPDLPGVVTSVAEHFRVVLNRPARG